MLPWGIAAIGCAGTALLILCLWWAIANAPLIEDDHDTLDDCYLIRVPHCGAGYGEHAS